LGDDEAAELDTPLSGTSWSAARAEEYGSGGGLRAARAELAEMDEKEAAELLSSYGLKEPGLNRLIRATYDLMGLIQFFTAGEPEVRAWTIRKGSTAAKAAGEIHSDIEKGLFARKLCDGMICWPRKYCGRAGEGAGGGWRSGSMWCRKGM